MASYITKNESGKWRTLTEPQKQKYLDTVVSLNNVIASRKVQLVYRGVGLEHLRNIFPDDQFDIDQMIDKLFYFGEKSRYHYGNGTAENPMRRIDDYSGALASELFQSFAKLGRENPDDLGVDRLIRRDPDFFQFFEKKENEPIFRRKLIHIGPEAFTYYLAILHTAGMPKTNAWSSSLSSSTDPGVAEKFPAGGESAFVVTAVHRFRNEKKSAVILNDEGLPALSSEKRLFPGEREITLSGALMPHNILHVRKRGTERYWINPHLFSDVNQQIDMSREMLYINQSDFAERIARETNYNGWFYRLPDGRIVHGGFVDARIAPALKQRGAPKSSA